MRIFLINTRFKRRNTAEKTILKNSELIFASRYLLTKAKESCFSLIFCKLEGKRLFPNN